MTLGTSLPLKDKEHVKLTTLGQLCQIYNRFRGRKTVKGLQVHRDF